MKKIFLLGTFFCVLTSLTEKQCNEYPRVIEKLELLERIRQEEPEALQEKAVIKEIHEIFLWALEHQDIRVLELLKQYPTATHGTSALATKNCSLLANCFCKDITFENLTVTESLTLTPPACITTSCLNILDADSDNAITIHAPSLVSSYSLSLPAGVGLAGQVLTTDGNNPAELTWQDAAVVITGTSCAIPDILVLRDGTGSFAATTLTCTGDVLLRYVPKEYPDDEDEEGISDSCVGVPMLSAYGEKNIFLGINAGNSSVLGRRNISVGESALAANIDGSYNIAIGGDALLSNTLGNSNIAIGDEALSELVAGDNNIVIGDLAGGGIIDASYTICIGSNGYNSGNAIFIGSPGIHNKTTIAGIRGVTPADPDTQVVIIDANGQLGSTTMGGVTTGTSCATPNTLVQRDGNSSFSAGSITLSNNVLLSYTGVGGCNAGSPFLTYKSDTFDDLEFGSIHMGINAGNVNGFANIAIGNNALSMNEFIDNIAIGNSVLEKNIEGNSNVAIGNFTLQENVGSFNTAVGSSALAINVIGENNTVIGANAAAGSTQGSRNTVIGSSSFTNDSSGSDNTIIGYRAGSPGSNNICIGARNGLAEETGVIRIGTKGDLDEILTTSCFIDGIRGVIPTDSDIQLVVIDTSGQLGSQALSVIVSGTSGNIPNTLVLRDENGGFYSGMITANLTGTATYALDSLSSVTSKFAETAEYAEYAEFANSALSSSSAIDSLTSTSAQYLTGNFLGDVVGTQDTTQVVTICGAPACDIVTAASAIFSATHCNNTNTLVKRDGSGSFIAGSIALQNSTLLTYSAGGSTCDVGSRVLSVPRTDNIFLGLNSGNLSLIGDRNVAVGSQALSNVIYGTNNTAIGFNAGSNVINGEDNIYIGANVTGSSDDVRVMRIGIPGVQSRTIIAGINNTPLSAPRGIVIVDNDSRIGSNLDYLITLTAATSCNEVNRLVKRDGSGSFIAGSIALQNSTLLTYSAGGSGCDVGSRILSVPGIDNIFLGLNSGNPSLSGTGNVAVGGDSLNKNTNGHSNTAVGYQALANVMSGISNTAIGFNAGADIKDGGNNIYIGSNVRGSLLDSNVIQIGTPGVQSKTIIAGINDTTLSVPAGLVIIDSSGQLGSSASYLNTLTTATSCNLVNSIVKRDSNGSFIGYSIGLKSQTLLTHGGSACDAGNPVLRVSGQNLSLGLNAGLGDSGNSNTAIGYEALQGSTGGQNTAVGASALKPNTTGINNVAVGYNSGSIITTGSNNIYIGAHVTGSVANENNAIQIGLQGTQNKTIIAGISGITPPTPTGLVTINNAGQLGSCASYLNMLTTATSCNNPNTFVKRDGNGNFISSGITLSGRVLLSYTEGESGCDQGDSILSVVGGIDGSIYLGKDSGNLTTNSTHNTAVGNRSLTNISSGYANTAIGWFSLVNATTGVGNIALGSGAGVLCQEGSYNIYIGSNGKGFENNTIRIGGRLYEEAMQRCFIDGISGVNIGSGSQVFINSSGQLGTNSSSQRYKENIKDMGDVTQDIYNLRPVVFNYKTDASKRTEYGLIAEEVEEFYPGIVVKNKDGLPETVQYQYLPMMMLNEMQKQHAEIAEFKKEYLQNIAELRVKNQQLEDALAELQRQ